MDEFLAADAECPRAHYWRAAIASRCGTVANAFVSHLAAAADELIGLIAELRRIATQRGIELLTLGFAANDPRLATLRSHVRCREYRSRLYVVRWPEIGGAARELDDRFLAPEVASL